MRDSYDDFEYEDELDRMRARKARGTRPRPRPAVRMDDDPEEDWDDDLDYDSDYDPEDDLDYDPDDDPEEEDGWEEVELTTKPPARKVKKPAGSGRRSSNEHRSKGNSKRAASTKNSRTKNQRPQKKKKRRFGLVLLLVLLIACGGIAFSFWNQAGRGYWTVAVFGLDGRDGNLDRGALSDVELLCTVNRETGEIKLVSVFRDTYLQISSETDTYYKINQAYHKGGHTQAVSALENNLDLSIDDYASFNWKAVADTINLLGGIDLEITDKEFAYINSFITETVESTGVPSVHLQSSGMNHLDGVQAVAYARLRLMDTDFKRTERQRRVIGLTLEKAKQADFATLNNIIVTVLPQISTSVNAADLLALAKNIDKYYIGETSGFPFAHVEVRMSGQEFVVPATLESNVIQLHQVLYGTENFKPSQTVRAINQRIIADSGVGTVGTDTESGRDVGLPSNGSNNPAPTQAPTAAETPAATEPAVTEPVTDEAPETETEASETSDEIPEVTTIPESESRPEPSSEIPTAPVGPGINPESTAPVPETAEGEKPTTPTTAEVGPGVGLGDPSAGPGESN